MRLNKYRNPLPLNPQRLQCPRCSIDRVLLRLQRLRDAPLQPLFFNTGRRLDPRIQLGKTLRRRRLALGLSQEGLAEKADLHLTYIGGIERGERNLSLLNIVRLARALGITASQLLVLVDIK